MTIVYQTSRRETVVVRCVVSRELADKLRRKATEENSTLSDMVARLLAAAIEKE
jgi:hypothetical protein